VLQYATKNSKMQSINWIRFNIIEIIGWKNATKTNKHYRYSEMIEQIYCN